MIARYFVARGALLLLILALVTPIRGLAQGVLAVSQPLSQPAPQPTYADLAQLADSAPMILKVLIRKVAVVEAARARDVAPGHARLYIEAQPLAVIAGSTPQAPVLAPDVAYLVDVPLDARGRPPALKKTLALLFARGVAGTAAELQLVTRDGQLPWSQMLEDRLRAILAELVAPGAPTRITAVSELSYVPGALVGEGETQIFLATASGTPASITVAHRPAQPVSWSVSFSEVVDAAGRPPAKDTLAWYRLACFLPDVAPEAANISDNDAAKAQAATDYAIVKAELGPCARSQP